MPGDWNRLRGMGTWFRGSWNPPLLFPIGKALLNLSHSRFWPLAYSPLARIYSHLQVPALALSVEISPTSSILVAHQGSWQATQHGNHIVMDGASSIVGLQELWASFRIKNNSTWSNSNLKACATPSYGQWTRHGIAGWQQAPHMLWLPDSWTSQGEDLPATQSKAGWSQLQGVVSGEEAPCLGKQDIGHSQQPWPHHELTTQPLASPLPSLPFSFPVWFRIR